jgi:hypothetical protein
MYLNSLLAFDILAFPEPFLPLIPQTIIFEHAILLQGIDCFWNSR